MHLHWAPPPASVAPRVLRATPMFAMLPMLRM